MRLFVAIILVITTSFAAVGSSASAVEASTVGCLPVNGLMNLNDADDLLAGKVRLDASTVAHLGVSNINWSHTSLPSGSARLLYSLKWVEELIREYRKTGDVRYRDRAVALVVDFAVDNPVNGGPDPSDAWDPMYGGQRTTAIACVASVSGDPRVEEALASHGRWLSDVVGDMPPWNQAIDPNLGLLMAGCRVGVPAWRSLAMEEFSFLITKMIDSEGALLEQAPGYGTFVWERWRVVQDTMSRCGMQPPAEIPERRAALLNWLAWMSAPDGTTTPLGDTFRVLPPPTPAASPTAYTVPGGTTGSPPAGTVKVFSAGYVAGRSSWVDLAATTYWTLRFGPGRDYHGHEDHTAVTFWSKGREVLIDSGHGGYRDSTYREALRSPEAHNVLMLPGVDFRIRRPTELVRSSAGAGWRFDEVRDDVYSRQGGRTIDAPRTRGVLVLPDAGVMVVQDRATRLTEGVFEQLWHLVPGSKVISTDRAGIVARHPAGDVDIHIRQVPLPGQQLERGATTVVEGQLEPALGWYSESDGHRTPAPVVRSRRTGTEARMVTVITTSKVGEAVTTTARLADRGWMIDVARGGERFDVGIGGDGSMQLGPPPESGQVPAGGMLRVPVVGVGGVPLSGVSAVALNVTAVRASAPGYLSVFPCGSSVPSTSSVNYQAGGAWPNGVVVPVDSTGAVCVWSYSATDVIVDVAGWFADGVGQATDRLIDTREGGRLGAAKVLRVPVVGVGGVPLSGVSAVALNVTAVRASAPGYLSVFPCGSSVPSTSSVNYQAGGAWPNGVVVPVDSTGAVCVWSYSATDVIVDVAGWFADGVGQATDRLIDTRNE